MKIKTETDSILQIYHFSIGIALFGWTMSLIILFLLIKGLINETLSKEHLISLPVSFLISFFGGSAFGKKEVFTVNKNSRTIDWSRRGIFGEAKGKIPFDHILEVIIQKTMNGSTYSYRLSVKTETGIIPVSQVYSLGAKEECETIQTKIIKMIS
ncbi:MAG: hypothetical protein D3926_24510 [Desulfobacteraceae bacterium]|nr:MAG: hypothetical protein D3926_24510 [Desulfobacteraceae bacterium]